MNNLDITGFCEKTNDNTQLLILLKSAYRGISLMKKVQKYRNMQKNILESVPEIFKLLPISTILEKILEEIIPLVNSNQAFILIDDYLKEGTIYCGLGKYDRYQNIGQELFEKIGYTRTQSSLKFINNGLYLPLILQDKSIGIIYVETKDPIDTDDLDILNIYSSLVSSSLSNAILHSMINIKNEELTRTREKLAQWYVEVVDSMRETINAKDKYTCGHSDRVTDYSIKIGKELGLSETELNTLKNGGIFHDIGKIGVPDSILKKEGKLEFDEYKEIQTHPERGAFILSAVSMFKDVVPLVLYHHEKYDGTGYPKKLKGEEIPLMARILSVADALDAMTTDRGYKNKRTLEDAISELKKGAGKQFDSNVVNLCIELIRKNIISIKD
jgi:HD-GYP domain-containing protein (c-di-GMP phosphodiesterase class II)